MRKIIIIMMVMLGLTGCGVSRSGAAALPLVSPLSQKEIVDYYKQALNYKNTVKRNLQFKPVNFELKDVEGSMKGVLDREVGVIEGELYSHVYKNDFKVTQQQHGYIKSIIDDKVLVRDKIEKYSTSLGYYFVDVKYNIRANGEGSIIGYAQYLGIHGAFKQDINGNSYIDNNFLALMNNNKQGNTNVTTTNSGVQSAENSIGREITGIAAEYNRSTGGSLTNTAFMPELSKVYSPVGESGSIAGYGIFPQGDRGLKKFGYNRNSTDGSIVLRYVFKGDITKPSVVNFYNVYMVGMELGNGIKGEDVIVPQFVEEEIRKLVERSDRAISNNDIAAIMSGDIYNDIGIAILNGFYQNSTYLMLYMSDVNKVIGRQNDYYLAEVETTIQEGAKGTRAIGTYRDIKHLAIKQVGAKFIIDDIVCVKRELVKEPQVELDDSITKRLVALGLKGEIKDDTKNSIKELLNKLYKASTDRKLKDMYDCFESDVNILPSTKKEYLNSQLRGWLTKYGASTKSNYNGIITEWIGGSSNQAELVTEELITYDGKDTGQYMKIYYLVSNINNSWTIAEMKVIEVKSVKGSELQSLQQRIK